jgi:predicted MFS family arabinose efflux permease
LLPRVVERDELTVANAALAASTSLARLVGSPVGGLVVAWGGLTPVIVLDACSFLAVAVALGFLTADTRPRPPDEDHAPGVRAGMRVVRRHPPLTQLLSVHGLAQIAQGAFVVLFVVFVVDVLGDDGPGVGIIRGTMAIGAIGGAALIARSSSRADPTVLFGVGLIGMGAVALLFWNAPEVTTALWVYVLLFSLSGIPGAALSVGLVTTIQTRTPPHALGRVVGLMGSMEAVGAAAGSILAGVLVDRVALHVLLDAQAAVYLLSGVLAFVLVVPHRAQAEQTTGP